MFDNNYDHRWQGNDRCWFKTTILQSRPTSVKPMTKEVWRKSLNRTSLATSSNSLSNTDLQHFQSIICGISPKGKFLIPSHTETQSRREWGMYRRPFSPKLGVTGASQALPRPIQSSFWGGDRSLKRRNSGWTGVLREGYRAGNLPVGWRGEGWGPTHQ